jgi:hypothetical protein
MSIDRRRFLQLTALGIVATVGDGCAPATDQASIDHPQLLAMLGPDRVRQLGARYRSATPSENTVDALRSAITKDRGSKIPFLAKESADEQIADDFANGRTVLVDGWVLSVTEARQAALFSLTPV